MQQIDTDPCDQEINGCCEDQGEKSFVGSGADDIRHFRQILYGDVSDNGGGLDQRNDLPSIDTEDFSDCLGEYDPSIDLQFRQTECFGRFDLSMRYAFDAAVQCDRCIAAEINGKRDDRNDDLIQASAGEDDIEADHQRQDDWQSGHQSNKGIHECGNEPVFAALQQTEEKSEHGSAYQGADGQNQCDLQTAEDHFVSVFTDQCLFKRFFQCYKELCGRPLFIPDHDGNGKAVEGSFGENHTFRPFFCVHDTAADQVDFSEFGIGKKRDHVFHPIFDRISVFRGKPLHQFNVKSREFVVGIKT